MIPQIVVSLLFTRVIASENFLNRISCDFNERHANKFCDYSSHPQLSFYSWSINNGTRRDSNRLDEPLTRDGTSNFLVLNATRGWLMSSESRLSGKVCFSLDFYLVSTYQATLRIYALGTERERQKSRDELNRDEFRHYQFNRTLPFEIDRDEYNVFTRNHYSSYVDRWQHYKTTLNFRDDIYQLNIQASKDAAGIIAIDNLKFTQGPCEIQENENKICDFDNVVRSADTEDLNCDWLQIVNSEGIDDNMKPRVLRRFDASTASQHGGVLLAEEFHGRSNPEIHFGEFKPEGGAWCLSFMMNTVNEGEIRIIENATDSHISNTIYSVVHDTRTYGYSFHQVDIDPVVEIRVYIRLMSGLVIFDSVKLTKGKCSRPLDCNFKEDFCGWSADTTYTARLLLGNGRLGNPAQDYVVSEHSKFLYIDLDAHASSATGVLLSKHIHRGGQYCLKLTFENQTQFEMDLEIRDRDGIRYLRHNEGAFSYSNTESVSEVSVNITSKNQFHLKVKINKIGSTPRMSKTFKIFKTYLDDGSCGFSSPIPAFSPVKFHCHQTGHYIPAYRTCDGVIDCPMGEDEGELCNNGHDCSNGGIPCKRRGHKLCLTNANQICNGDAYCDDAMDEDPGLCNKDSFCDNFCLNGGECAFESFSCQCKNSFTGKRCAREQYTE